MITIVWDSEGVIYIDYMEKGKTASGLHYAEFAEKAVSFCEEKYAFPI